MGSIGMDIGYIEERRRILARGRGRDHRCDRGGGGGRGRGHSHASCVVFALPSGVPTN